MKRFRTESPTSGNKRAKLNFLDGNEKTSDDPIVFSATLEVHKSPFSQKNFDSRVTYLFWGTTLEDFESLIRTKLIDRPNVLLDGYEDQRPKLDVFELPDQETRQLLIATSRWLGRYDYDKPEINLRWHTSGKMSIDLGDPTVTSIQNPDDNTPSPDIILLVPRHFLKTWTRECVDAFLVDVRRTDVHLLCLSFLPPGICSIVIKGYLAGSLLDDAEDRFLRLKNYLPFMRFGLDYAAFTGNIRAAVIIVANSNRRNSTMTSSLVAVHLGHEQYIEEGKRREWDCGLLYQQWDSTFRDSPQNVWDRWMVDHRDEQVGGLPSSPEYQLQLEKQRQLARDPSYVY